MASLIDLIQSNRLVNVIVLFALWWTGLTFKFSKQCHLFHDARHPERARGRSLRRRRIELLPRLARIHITFVLVFYYASFLKYAALIALDFETFAAYRQLDCYLLGHYVFYGRTDKASKYVAALMFFAVASYKLTLVLARVDFKFYCLEFLLRGYNEAYEHELRFRQRTTVGTATGAAATGSVYSTQPTSQLDKYWDSAANDGLHQQRKQSGKRLMQKSAEMSMDSKLIYYVRSCDGRADGASYCPKSSQFYLRPSRSAHSWLKLSKFAIVSFLIYTIATYVWVSLRLASILSALVTHLGYRLTYNNCFKWQISQPQQQQGHTSGHAYDPETLNLSAAASKLPAILPLADLLPLDLYHICRILWDVVDFLLLDLEILLSFWVHFSIIATMSYELYLSQVHIRAKLLELIETLELARVKVSCYENYATGARALVDPTRGTALEDGQQQQQHQRTERNKLIGNNNNSSSKTPSDYTLQDEIVGLQSILVDHFLTIIKYNRYVSLHNTVVIAVWLLFNFILCGWLGLVGGDSIRIEFYIVQFLFYVLVLFQLLVVAATQLFSRKLYKLICSAMALDTSYSSIRLRWITILRFYYPKPLYCFALFGSAEVSMFFCIKILSWLLSGMIVYASFLSSYKGVSQF